MEQPRRDPVGIVGVGNMGGAMAARLLEAGWPVQVCDIDLHRVRLLELQGAQVRHTAAQCATGVAVLIVCVVDSPQVDTVLFGPAGAASVLRAGQDVLLCPTIAPQDTERFAARLLEQGVCVIDAPMSGGPARARDGSMSLMLAGGGAVIDRRRELIAALSDKVFRISARPGDGARSKLVNNLLAGINLVGAAEAIALAERLGLDAASTLALIGQSSGQSWIGSDRMQRAIAGDFEPRAHMTLLEKDTRLALQAAAAAGFEGPLGAAAHAVFARACAAGLAQRDDGALLQLLRQPPVS
ncbi:NAD(P)-dependent oxidoreductase [Caenimonas terrae]|uniref:NAD(P)-dependent oxidoreductase n=1 Tax=Caenimonas terrae TaxID=696074 RepID=A0ABW0NHV3_9BURK